jgi:nitrous oxide reductase accessory protein NosL
MAVLSLDRPLQARRALLLLRSAVACSSLLALWAVPVAWQALAPAAVPVLPPDVCVVAPPVPYDPASGLPLTAPRVVPADARCPVCGMYPARSPGWAAQVIFGNGDAQFFDSPLSLFIYLQDVGRYSRGHRVDEIVASYVSDADSGRWLPAPGATYVLGSSASGPMRAGNLPAFAETAAAQRFALARGGTVLHAADITPELLRRLDGAAAHRH